MNKTLETTSATMTPGAPVPLVCVFLRECPFCAKIPEISAMRYRNTGNIFGHQIRCTPCNFQKSITPVCWEQGGEQKAMDDALIELVNWWNTRKQ